MHDVAVFNIKFIIFIDQFVWKKVIRNNYIDVWFDFFRDICSKNYHTVTELAFQPYKENSGKEPLPSNVHQVGSGFVRQSPITFPNDSEVITVVVV